MKYQDFDWFDHEYAQWYICKHAKVFFRFETYMDPVGYVPWSERSFFDFRCYLLMFADNRIRSYHYIPLGEGESKARFETNSITDGKQFLTEHERRHVNFTKSMAVKT